MKLINTQIQERSALQRVQSSNNVYIIKQAFLKKGAVPTNLKIFYDNSGKLFIYANVFYTAKTLSKYNKKFKKKFRFLSKKKRKEGTLKKLGKKRNISNNVLPTYVSINKINTKTFVRWGRKTIDDVMEQEFFEKNFKDFKKYRRNLFPRSTPLFFDFLKMFDLVCTHMAHPENLLIMLGQIFKTQHKKKHNQFKYFLVEFLKTLFNKYKGHIIGMSIKLSGRLSGKSRSSSVKIIKGFLRTSTISINTYSSQIHVYNKYGCFGMKFVFHYRKALEGTLNLEESKLEENV